MCRAYFPGFKHLKSESNIEYIVGLTFFITLLKTIMIIDTFLDWSSQEKVSVGIYIRYFYFQMESYLSSSLQLIKK